MAPEIINKKDYRGSVVDIWTCGIVFYTLLTGCLPFLAHTDREMTRKILKGIYHIPKEMNKDIVRAINRMLNIDAT
jgi:serine/threonine protein kinase